jgi:hypothetical protein
VLGGWYVRGSKVLPSLSELPGVVSRILEDANYADPAMYSAKFKHDVSPEYTAYVLNTLEGLAPQVLDNKAASSYIYTRLVESSPPIAQAIDQFKNANHTTLDRVCATIATLTRSNPATRSLSMA